MCLLIDAISAGADRAPLVAAASRASSLGLHVEVGHASRWSWAKDKEVRATISEDGGCSCSLLSDDADWNADTWAMRSDVLDLLGATLEALARHGPSDLVIEALWAGDKAQTTVRITPRELAALASSSQLGTRTRYIVVVDAEP